MPRSKKQFEIERPACDLVLEGLAVEQLHHDVRTAVFFADVVDRADVGMIQRGRGLRLAPEAFERLRVAGQIFRKEFQGDEAAEIGVFRFVNHAHAAATEFFDHAVARNHSADDGLRVRHGPRC